MSSDMPFTLDRPPLGHVSEDGAIIRPLPPEEHQWELPMLGSPEVFYGWFNGTADATWSEGSGRVLEYAPRFSSGLVRGDLRLHWATTPTCEQWITVPVCLMDLYRAARDRKIFRLEDFPMIAQRRDPADVRAEVLRLAEIASKTKSGTKENLDAVIAALRAGTYMGGSYQECCDYLEVAVIAAALEDLRRMAHARELNISVSSWADLASMARNMVKVDPKSSIWKRILAAHAEVEMDPDPARLY